MNHLTESQLNEYLDNAISAQKQRIIEMHISECAECHNKLEDMRGLFTTLAGLPEEALHHDLTPLVMSRLPDQKLRLGWKLVLGVQAGITLGLITLLAVNLLPIVSRQTVAAVFSLKLPIIELPVIHLPSFVLPTFSLQPSTGNLVFLAASALILWGVGNATLLRGRREIQK